MNDVIEQQSELNQKIEWLESQLTDAQRMASLGLLLSTTTHEFNNILMTVINYAKMGLRRRDDATRDKALDKILDAAQRASRITSGILSLSRSHSQSREPTDLGQVVDDVLLLLERELRKHKVRVDKRLQKTPPAMANSVQIQQVLMNLMVNARQAMPSGGVITLKLWHDADSDMNCLMVRDSGHGISREKLPSIFDPFYSTKAGPDATGKGGTGLGLSSCKDIIEEHRGRIRVDSSPGIGTAFIIKLPVAVPTAESIKGSVPTNLSGPVRPRSPE